MAKGQGGPGDGKAGYGTNKTPNDKTAKGKGSKRL